MVQEELKCLFCDRDLPPPKSGRGEHVFLSALGGRIVTGKAVCHDCNGAFARIETDKADDELAESFIIARNALQIWSGRKDPPPIIEKAGVTQNGIEYDLVSGFVPVFRSPKLPTDADFLTNPVQNISAIDEEDRRKKLEIINKRGHQVHESQRRNVQEPVGWTNLKADFRYPILFRAIGKLASVAACVLYGNINARHKIDLTLRKAARYGTTPMIQFVTVDTTNQWPVPVSFIPHARTPEAKRSGFEHSIYFADIRDDWVAYIELFGNFRFSMRLGAKSELPPRGLSVNPRTPSRFDVKFTIPTQYTFQILPNKAGPDHDKIMKHVQDGFTNILETWSNESNAILQKEIAKKLRSAIEKTDSGSRERAVAISRWSEKLAAMVLGVRWEQEVDESIDID